MMGSKDNFIFGLAKSGQIYIWGEFSVPLPQEEGINQSSILQELNNSNVTSKQIYRYAPQQIQYEGTLYAWGDDSDQKHGLLGLGAQYKAMRPCPNSSLFDYMIKQISLSESHACAVDSTGRLFSWGYGPNGELGLDQQIQQISTPTIVTKQKQINIKKAICHANYTAFCSGKLLFINSLGAGYVYFFGSLIQPQDKMRQSQQRFNMPQQMPQNHGLQKSSSQLLFEQQKNVIAKSSRGDAFILALTSTQDVYFVDDSLESVQINIAPIESLAILGTKIMGMALQTSQSNSSSIFEWSTAGLNKLSFNKENKMLLKQDFQIREFKFKSEFTQGTRLCNFMSSKNSAALIFDDIGYTEQKFQQLVQKEEELNLSDDQIEQRLVSSKNKILIAEYSQAGVKQSQFNPLMMMSDSSIITSFENECQQLQEKVQIGSKVSNLEPVPALDPSPLNYSPTPSQAKNSFITYHEKSPIIQKSFKLQTENQDNFLNEKESIFSYQAQPFSYQQMQNNIPPNHFFFDSDAQTANQQTLYRPSSIKSYKQSQNKSSPSQNNNNHYSSPSLKQCAAEIMPLMERNSKIEISFPSFLNYSGGANGESRNQNSNQEKGSSGNQDQIKSPYGQNDKYEFSIRLQQQKEQSEPRLNSSYLTEKASVIQESQYNSQLKEDSMIVTFDNFQIKAKRTTTPRRLLNGYSMSKRSFTSVTPSEKNPIQNPQSSQLSKLSSSQQSQISNGGFNLTTQSCRTREGQVQNRATINSNKENIADSASLLQTQQKKKAEYIQKKLSNSCGTHRSKRASFMKAILSTCKPRQHFDINNNFTSVTQNFIANPFQEESKLQKQVQQSKISEEDANLMMSSSEGDQVSAQPYGLNNMFGGQIQNVYRDVCEQDQIINVTQTEDDIEIEYSISDSCSHNSQEQSSNIMRRINFDDSSANRNSDHLNRLGGNSNLIKMLESTSTKNRNANNGGSSSSRIFAQFKFTINNHSGSSSRVENNTGKNGRKSGTTNQNNNSNADQSQSFVFHQCQSPPPVQPFYEENPVSNIKSNSTPTSQHDNTTHIMLMTEEKFKNLKSEISLNEQQQNQQCILTQSSNLLNSPNMNDFNGQKQYESKSIMLLNTQSNISISNLQNLSGFIKQNKYLQVYENYRKAFMTLCNLNDLNKQHALRRLKQETNNFKQKKEFLQGMARFLFNTLKNHISLKQQIGFKRIKKFYKEKQLQVYIRRKQNEFALKSQILIKIDSIIVSHNNDHASQSFLLLKNVFEEQRKINNEKKRKGLIIIHNFISRKHKYLEEKTLRQIDNYVHQKKIIEMRIKMMMRVLSKMITKKSKLYYSDFKKGIWIKVKREAAVRLINKHSLRQKFAYLRSAIQQKSMKQEAAVIIQDLYKHIQNKQQQNIALLKFKRNRSHQIHIEQTLQEIVALVTRKQLQIGLKTFIGFSKHRMQKEKSKNISKALFMVMHSKIQELLKQKLRLGFKELYDYTKQHDETMMIAKSLTSGNLSFSGNSLANDPSLILNRHNKEKDSYKAYFSIDGPKKKYSLKPSSNPLGKSCNSFAKKNLNILQKESQSNQQQQKPTLNDYLNYSPMNLESTQQVNSMNKFQIRRKTEANTARTNGQKKSQIDCPIPQQITKQQPNDAEEKRSRNAYGCKRAESNSNKLNVSIKDMNRAFKDEVSRIKVKQGTSDESSNQDSSQNFGDSLVNTSQKENYTPELLFITTEQSYNDINNSKVLEKKRRSPQVNPLSTSETIYGNGLAAQYQTAGHEKRGIEQVNNQQKMKQNVLQLQQPTDLFLSQMNSQTSHPCIDTFPKTGTFGEVRDHYGSESIHTRLHEQDANLQLSMIQSQEIDDYQVQIQDPSNNKKNDSRYQRFSCLEQDFSMDYDQSHNMFDEFDLEEKEQQIIRLQCTNNIGMSMAKSSIADLSRKLDLTTILAQGGDISQDIMALNNYLQGQAHFDDRTGSSRGMNHVMQTSPKFSESFIPGFNREALNEMAQNFQMMELTPEADVQMMLNNKSIYNKEESIYSNNQYAEPVEMTLSPRQLQFQSHNHLDHRQKYLSNNQGLKKQQTFQAPQAKTLYQHTNPQNYVSNQQLKGLHNQYASNQSHLNYYQQTQNSYQNNQNNNYQTEMMKQQILFQHESDDEGENVQIQEDDDCMDDNDFDDCEEGGFSIINNAAQQTSYRNDFYQHVAPNTQRNQVSCGGYNGSQYNSNGSQGFSSYVQQKTQPVGRQYPQQQQYQNKRDPKPYDFELSSNSKYKIISEDEQKIHNILRSEIQLPSMTNTTQAICKKLSFGNEARQALISRTTQNTAANTNNNTMFGGLKSSGISEASTLHKAKTSNTSGGMFTSRANSHQRQNFQPNTNVRQPTVKSPPKFQQSFGSQLSARVVNSSQTQVRSGQSVSSSQDFIGQNIQRLRNMVQQRY